LFPILIAVVLGISAALFAHHWMQSRIAAVEAQKRGGVPVVVATAEISFGEKIDAAQVKTIGWPPDSVPQEALNDVSEVVGRVSAQKLVPGEVVLRSRLSQIGNGSSLAGMIEANHRAVTVRVNDVIGVAGFLLPGNRVDVLATRLNDNHRAESRTILENVKVLAVDQTAQAEKDQPVVVRAVTLEVDPDQAEQLAKATEEGSVQLSLRNPNDTSTGNVAAATEPVAVAPAPAPAPAKPGRPARRVAREQPPESITVIHQAQVGAAAPIF
jgi:pilus assembly protein CpaB